jgi:threonine/homoserine/homoserine lactone efflux protein
MQWAAATLLLLLAATMLRRSVRELRAAPLDELASHPDRPAHDGIQLWARLAALTLMNPLTIVAFTSLVVATGERASNVGWPLGIAVASLGVHLLLVVLGSSVRKALPPLGPSWLWLAGSLLIAGLAANLVVH